MKRLPKIGDVVSDGSVNNRAYLVYAVNKCPLGSFFFNVHLWSLDDWSASERSVVLAGVEHWQLYAEVA